MLHTGQCLAILLLSLLVSPLWGAALAAAPGAALPDPQAFFRHPLGADRTLASYPDVVAYMRAVATASDRVSVESAGRSTLDNEMVVVVVTSAANQQRLERYREIARRLARPEGLSPEGAAALVEEGKAVVLVTCTIHATEVGCTQMAPELVHELAASRDPEVEGWLEEVILLLMPSINPDGQILVRDWYLEHLGTEHEGGPMPWLYHHYVGHDNNRDFYMLTQAESRVVNHVLYHRWFPQVFVDEHQMGRTGPRMFVPPQTDPLAPEIDSLVFRQADLLGTAMALRLEEAGKLGVGSNMIFDSYWPGGTRNTAWWKNVTGLLTEVASARIATPVYVEPGELRGGQKGLPEYGRRANYPTPWPGGWWRLRDIMDYERIATLSLLETCARERRTLLRNMHRLASEQMARGRVEAPSGFLIPPEQHDPVAAGKLVDLLLLHGVEARRAVSPFQDGLALYPAGTVVIPAAQPYRPFLLTMLRPQRYPEVIPYEGGPIFPPYDVTSWSLPLAMGVEVQEATGPLPENLEPLAAAPWDEILAGAGMTARADHAAATAPGSSPTAAAASGAAGHLVSHAADSAFRLTNALLAAGHPVYWLREAPAGGRAGDIYIPAQGKAAAKVAALAAELRVPLRRLEARPGGPAWRLAPVRIGLYKPWVASMDEGWTRFVLEQYGFPYTSVANEAIRDGSFARKLDLLLLPDVDKDILAEGKPADEERARRFEPLPPRYAGGLGEEGGEHLKRWITEEGGTVVALDSSADYLISLLGLPVTNVLAGVKEDRFLCPGAMLQVEVDTAHPLAFGLRAREAAYFADSPAFATHLPDGRFQRRVVARYPGDERDILMSGYLHGGGLLERRAAVVDLSVGKGRVVLIGFRAQHRAQPLRTFKLLFNALSLPGLSPADL